MYINGMNLVFLDPDTPYPKIVETRSALMIDIVADQEESWSERPIQLFFAPVTDKMRTANDGFE